MTWLPIGEIATSERVLLFSPEYEKGDSMRLRMVDGKLARTCIDATHFLIPKEPDDPVI